MKTHYKIGKMSKPVEVSPGDRLNLSLTERNFLQQEYKQSVSEEITVSMTVTHWVMFYIPGVGLGGLFGGPDIGEKMSEVFVEPELVSDDEQLIGG